jgi:hypothetical protein
MARVKSFRPARALAWAALLLASLGPVAIFVLYGLSRRWFYPDLWPDEWTFAPIWRQLTDPRTRAAAAAAPARPPPGQPAPSAR